MSRFSQNIAAIIIFALMLGIGFVARGIYARYEVNRLDGIYKQQETDFVVPAEFIKNKAFRDWRTNIHGIIKEKSKNNLVVESEDKLITLRVISLTSVRISASEVNDKGEQTLRETSLEDVLVGDKIEASIIFPDGQAEASTIIVETEQGIISGIIISVNQQTLMLKGDEQEYSVKLSASTAIQRLVLGSDDTSPATFTALSYSELKPGFKIIVEVTSRGNNLLEAQRIILRDIK